MDILLIGCGRMGSAMLERWAKSEAITRIDVIDPHVSERDFPQNVFGFATVDDWAKEARVPDMAVLAIKPQSMEASCPTIANALPIEVGIMSVVTGFDFARLAGLVGQGRGVVRAMPNTPAAIGLGVTGYILNKNISQKQKDISVCLCDALGISVPLEHEGQMDALTAISGSGPAYFYLFTESLAQAGVALGLPNDMAQALARGTFIGAAGLLAADAEVSPATLRAGVTSPNGTTQAAIEVFEKDDGLVRLVKEACAGAAKRADEINKNV